MRKFFVFISIIAVLGIACLSSCSKSENGKVEFIPFQETVDGQWGMISMTGEVLFSEEFKTKPTVVKDGRFFVRKKNGGWEMYSSESKPKRVGAVEYAHVSGFNNGVALVSEKGKPVSIIDTDGKTLKVLDKLEGKIVDGVRPFKNGFAVFMTEDSLYGAINKNGDCIVKPQYCSLNDCGDGKFIGINDKYKKDVASQKKDKIKISVIDADGDILFEINGGKYSDIGESYNNGLLAVSVKKDAKEVWGLIDDKGEIVVKPTDKIKGIGTISGDMFSYNNGEGWGLMNVKGETLIRAKYEYLYCDVDGSILALIKKNEGTIEYKYVNEKDEQIGEETYVRATVFSMFDGEHALVKPNDKIFSIINKEGKQLDGLPDIVDVSTYEGEDYVSSDYVDLKKMMQELNISETTLSDFSFKTSPKEAVTILVKAGQALGNKSHPVGTPYWYDYTSNVGLSKKVAGVMVYTNVEFNDNLSRQTYRTKRVIDYTIGDYYWYHDDKIPTGYVWNKTSVRNLSLFITNDGRMKGKLHDVFVTLCAKFKTFGKIVKENNGAACFNLKNGYKALVAMKKDNVVAFWGSGLKDFDQIDITEYENVSEDDDMSKISFGYLNRLFPDNVKDSELDTDSVAVVDSAAVDLAY